MNIERIKTLLRQQESINLEFKEAATELPCNLFESICAMLNREGGDIILGVKDDGTVTGIDESRIDTLVTNLVNLSNNPNKLDPPFILHPSTCTIEGKYILHIAVPESSETHKTGNFIYDRSNDGDFKVTQTAQVAILYNRKRNHYSENRIYPYLKMSDFKTEMFPRIRNLIRGRYHNHPWLGLDDEQMLHKAGFYGRDPVTLAEGYNLASVLLFGRDETIANIVSHYKIDALLRREDVDRYDDRLYITTNLIEAYDLLMGFVEKHLPDKFYLQDDIRISLRSLIFREIVANLIVHREYTSGYAGTLVIYKDRIETQNPNNPRGNGLLLPDNFVPFSKNPLIARFFAQMGRVDELGSGILNVYKYLNLYSPGKQPQFIEDQIFRTIIPLDDALYQKDGALNGALNGAINGAISTQVRRRLVQEVRKINESEGLTLQEIMAAFSIERRTAQRDMTLLKEDGLVDFVGAKKTGKYRLTEIGAKLFGA